MIRRLLATTVLLLLAVGGFCGAGPGEIVPFNPFGLLFLGLSPGLVQVDNNCGGFQSSAVRRDVRTQQRHLSRCR